MGPAVELLLAKAREPDEGEAHGHLVTECPWYRNIGEEKNCGHDPGEHCPVPSGTGGGALVKFTPRTAEASTVPEPTVPPGGPGLFHIKGRQLPPYVQHLWHHLAPKYGKEKAYGMAVGIVKKWAQGIHPGGKKGGRVHPEVQAAAARNVAEWEKDKADAHRQSAEHKDRDKVRATSANPAPGPAYPGQKQTLLPPVPKVARAMYTAHRLNNVLNYLAHAEERLKAAKAGKAMRAYHMIHVNNHLSNSIDDLHKLVESLRLNYPAEYKELQALTRTMGLAKSESADARVATFAHLLQTVLYHLAHAKRHAEVMRTPDPDALWQFNFDHAAVHAKGALEHGFKLARHIQANYPEEAKWLDELVAVEDPGTDFTGLAAGRSWGAPGTRTGTASVVNPPGLREVPVATGGPRTLKPPHSELPTPAEVRALIGQVPDLSPDISLTRTVRKFLETAAQKLERDSPLDALASLRGAEAATYSAYKSGLPAPNAPVFAPPAEQSSATPGMAETVDRALAYRKVGHAITELAERIRRNFFHGVYNGPTNAPRLSARLG
jgi:hypothetical protein